MITIEQLEDALGENKNPFQTQNVDHDLIAISLLREKIPYNMCKSIISGAGHDVLYLCDVEIVLNYLDENDLNILSDCNVCLDDELGILFLFV